jgi:hypothetical protein
MRYLLDTNCIIALEEERDYAFSLRTLIAESHVCIAAIAASEKQQSGFDLPNFNHFRDRIKRLGLSAAELLLPPAYCGICYADWCLAHCEKFDQLERSIHAVLFPSMPYDVKVCIASGSNGWDRWRNAKCDVLTVWCHINYSCDVLVTDDRNFHKADKAEKLAELGCRSIVKPSELDPTRNK